MDYRSADEAVFSVVQNSLEAMTASVKSTKYPKTYSAMLSMIVRIASLKLSLFDLAEAGNPYAFQVVYRSFCEHYLRFMYIWFRFCQEKTDAVGEDFYDYCGAAEVANLTRSLKAAESIVGAEVTSKYEEVVGILFPKAKGMSRKEIPAKSDQFHYRTIVRYIAGKAPAIVSVESRFLVDVIRKYAELCVFVHGGPSTDQWAMTVVDGEAFEDCKKAADVVCMMSASVYMFTAAAMSREFPKLSQVAGLVNSILHTECE